MTNPENFSSQLNSETGTIRVGDLVGNPNVVFKDFTQGDSPLEKLNRAKGRGKVVGSFGHSLYDSIKLLGVKQPVSIAFHSPTEATVVEGHHRIIAAHDIDPNMMIPWEHPSLNSRSKNPGNCPSCSGEGLTYKENTNGEWDAHTCATCMGNGVV